jgi:exopolyphosphatase/guanosine-5'-triphosphate,3'-diphosphate pyrophosphatase
MMDSLRLGAVRLTNAFPQISGGPVSPDEYERVRAHVRNGSLRSVYQIRSLAPDIMVGSSGTILNLAEIAARSGKISATAGADGQSPAMKEAALAAVAKKLCSLSLDERRKMPGINPQRADIIIAGAAILQTLMEELGMDEITVSGRGLLEGMLQDYLTRGAYGYLDGAISTRERSVLQLGRSCGFNERHARQVAALAEKLFDSARAAGLHGYGAEERELLFYAALLHDAGLFLSFDDHHSHSRYIIKNTELLGFNQREIDVMANAAYFHRKWSGKRNRSDEYLTAMSREDRRLAEVLGAFLRMGEGLDRSQRQTVESAELKKRGRGVELRLVLSGPSQVEIFSVERAAGQFKKIFGMGYSVSVSPSSQ